MAEAVQLPYEVSRAWSDEWDLVPLLKGSQTAVCQTKAVRFLNPNVEVQLLPGRGRGIVATKPLETGELVLLDSPIVTAPAYAELLEAITSKATDDTTFRLHLLSMCGDPEDDAARTNLEQIPPAELVKNIVRRNYHGIEQPPVEGDLTSDAPPIVGLWPLGSIVNHSLRPNVTRSFAGHASCYRVIRPLKEGDEVLDNYLDLRLPRALRQELMQSNHGLDDEGPDSCDAPAQMVKDVEAIHARINKLVNKGTVAASKSAFRHLAELSNKCAGTEVTDPAFSNIFRDFALVAGQLGDAGMSLDGFAQALEFATAREPFNLISCVLALRMLHMASLAADEVPADVRKDLEELARKHLKMVYGPWPVFELFNPKLVEQLSTLAEPSQPATAEEGIAATATEGVAEVEGEERGEKRKREE